MSNRKWNKGKPPHRGWFNASALRDEEIWRFWDGAGFWSESVLSEENCMYAAHRANIKVKTNAGIEWCDYWPENARVPRINPDAKSEGVAG